MRHYGLIGKSLKHTFSPDFFKNYFSEQDIEATYETIELSDLTDCRSVLQKFSGCNVTIPYKEAIIPFLDALSPEAKAIGAVNVIQNSNGVLIGHNTDAFGFHNSIKPFLTNLHERAIIFGTGGAAKAVAYVLKNIGVDVIYVTRNPTEENQFAYSEVNENMLKACKLLVNTTPVGMFPNVNELLPIPYEALSTEHLLVDVIYNPEKTAFLQEGEKQGATILNGLSMLREQALKSYEIWSRDV